MDDTKSDSIEYELDRGVVALSWLRFLHQHPGAATIPPLHQLAHLNGERRAQGEKLVRPELFAVVLADLKRHQAKGNG